MRFALSTSAVALVALAGIALTGGLSVPARAQEAAAGAVKPEEPFQDLPILTWQEELDLNSTVRQVIFNAYLPMLARPTAYRGVHDDSIPNQVKDWDYQRPDVKNELLARQDVVDRQRRAHAALPDGEINHLITKKKDFRQEDFERLITTSPRFEDLAIVVSRVQPLGNEVFRATKSMDVQASCSGEYHASM